MYHETGQSLSVAMIVSFRDAWLEAFFVEDASARAIPANIEARLFRKLQLIDDA